MKKNDKKPVVEVRAKTAEVTTPETKSEKRRGWKFLRASSGIIALGMVCVTIYFLYLASHAPFWRGPEREIIREKTIEKVMEAKNTLPQPTATSVTAKSEDNGGWHQRKLPEDNVVKNEGAPAPQLIPVGTVPQQPQMVAPAQSVAPSGVVFAPTRYVPTVVYDSAPSVVFAAGVSFDLFPRRHVVVERVDVVDRRFWYSTPPYGHPDNFNYGHNRSSGSQQVVVNNNIAVNTSATSTSGAQANAHQSNYQNTTQQTTNPPSQNRGGWRGNHSTGSQTSQSAPAGNGYSYNNVNRASYGKR